MENKLTIVFLYTELAEYFIACIRELVSLFDVNVHIVRWPVNSEAPFRFSIPDDVTLYLKSDFDENGLKKLIDNVNPNIIFCSGWVDDEYTKTANYARKQSIPVVMGMDNPWEGNLRQHLASLISPITIKKYFDYVWVAGEKQKKYAEKLGFKNHQIISGCYSADYDLFHRFYEEYKAKKQQHFPHRFIYVGRYVEFKGLLELWGGFVDALDETNSDWELWCMGTGPMLDTAPKHPSIKHLGFIQPNEMAKYIEQTGVFVLPSHREPWGVVVHEFASAGFPLLCSDKVGSATAFIKNNWNGFVFPPNDREALKKVFIEIMESDDSHLNEMSERSAVLAQKITPAKWANQIVSLIEN